MSNQWTKEQLEAIESRGRNLLVAAAAGAGKTSVLVERIVRMITDSVHPVDVDRLLVVTFTNAAAAEMRERIGRSLGDALARHPDDKHLHRQLALLGRAGISTLHAFCLDLLRQHYYRVDLDPSFRVADETETVMLQAEALEELFERRYAGEKNALFTALVDSYGGQRDDAVLQELVLELYLFSRSTPRPEEWLKRLPGGFDLSEGVSLDQLAWSGALKKSLEIELGAALSALEQALGQARSPGGPGIYLANLEAEREMVQGLFQACAAGAPWDSLYLAFNEVAFGRLKACKRGNGGAEQAEQVRKIRDGVKKRIAALQVNYFGRPPEELCKDLRAVAPLVQELSGLVLDFGETYRRVKLARGVLDFNDLEHYCLQILEERNSDVRVSLPARPGQDSQQEPGQARAQELQGKPESQESPPERATAFSGESWGTGRQDGDPASPASSRKGFPSPVALELQDRFEEVLVDEYQDINAVQEAILQLVSRQGEKGSNLFLVGDVKQSIYRFRLADPGLFLQKYMEYPTRGDFGQSRRIDLAKNFRSRRGIIEAVNFLFRQLMTPGVGEMEYGPGEELVYAAGYPENPEAGAGPEESVEIHLIERENPVGGPAGSLEAAGSPESDVIPGAAGNPATAGSRESSDRPGAAAQEDGEGEEDLDAVQKEARLVAGRIKELVEGAPGVPPFAVYNRGQKACRPVTYRDVVVLLRAVTGYANIFMEEFRQAGVPAYAELATGYFEATEVETVLSLLKIIDNPRQDLPLAGVLRSPIVGLNAGEMAKVRLCARRGDYLDAVVAASLSDKGVLAERLTDFLGKLENWRTAARQGNLADLIWTLYRETGYYDFVGGLPGGGQRQANLRALLHRAEQYEATTFRGLFLFLRFIERIREGGRDLGAARFLSENENVVRLMSIHKSKGLEFPVVIVAGLGKRFNFKDLAKNVLFHKDLGLGPQLADPETRVTYPTVAKLAIRQKLKMEALSEEMRILYVALTRAREKLILVGSARNLENCARRWCGPVAAESWALPEGELGGAMSYLDWLMPAAARHRDGAGLRQFGHCGDLPPEFVVSNSSRWQVILDAAASRDKAGEKITPDIFERIRRMEPPGPAGPRAEIVRSRLEWTYPAAHAPGRAAKISVTELKRRFDPLMGEKEPSLADFRLPIGGRPLFLQEKRGLSAAEAGTALHLALQNLDLTGDTGAVSIAEQVDRMVERELLTREQAGSLPVERIAAFFTGELGKRVLSGHRVLRELPFTLVLPAALIYAEPGGHSESRVPAGINCWDFSRASSGGGEQAGKIVQGGRGFNDKQDGERDGGLAYRQGHSPGMAPSPRVPGSYPRGGERAAGASSTTDSREDSQGMRREEPAVPDLSVAWLNTWPGENKGETVLVQGVVDLLVDEGDGFLLVDYKSDRIPADQIGLAAARYRGQLNLYAMAVESILHRKVKEKYVYLFHLNRAVPL